MTHLTIERREGYEFLVRFDEDSIGSLIVDEAPPLGEGRGPTPSALLAAAVGSCLSASLLFCLGKSHIGVERLRTEIDLEQKRNQAGRMRIGSISAAIHVGIDPEQRERFERCKALFEQFCTVTESVRGGIPVDVQVSTDAGEPAQP